MYACVTSISVHTRLEPFCLEACRRVNISSCHREVTTRLVLIMRVLVAFSGIPNLLIQSMNKYVLSYTAFGRLWQHAKYSCGVWQSFPTIPRTFTNHAKSGSVINLFKSDFGPTYSKRCSLPARTPARWVWEGFVAAGGRVGCKPCSSLGARRLCIQYDFRQELAHCLMFGMRTAQVYLLTPGLPYLGFISTEWLGLHVDFQLNFLTKALGSVRILEAPAINGFREYMGPKTLNGVRPGPWGPRNPRSMGPMWPRPMGPGDPGPSALPAVLSKIMS
jgi:hypothetical protein